MHINEELESFAKSYISKKGKLDIAILSRIYHFDVYEAYQFLKANNKHAPVNLQDYPKEIKKLAEIYYKLL